MRASSILIALILTTYLSFSQQLKPQILISESDTLFGFTVGQSKYIAKCIIKAQGSDSIVKAYDVAIRDCDSLNGLKSDQINNLNLLLKNANEQTAIKQQEVNIRVNQNDLLKKEVKRQKVNKWIAYGLCFIFGFLAIK